MNKNNYQPRIDNYVRKSSTLFSEEEMFGRKIADKMQFDSILSEYAESIIVSIWMGIKRGQDVLSKESSFVVNWRNTKSNTYAPRVYEELSKLFSDKCGWLTGDRFYVNLSGYTLFFKMVTEDRSLPCSIPTKSATNIQDQLSYTEEDSPIIHICYVMDKSKMVLLDVVARYIKGNSSVWDTSLYDLANNQESIVDNQYAISDAHNTESISISNVSIKDKNKKDATNK